MKFTPMMYLDFGDSEIKEEGLPGRAAGKRTDLDEERLRVVKEMQDRSQFLKHSNNHFVPLIKFFNEDYVYVYFVSLLKVFEVTLFIIGKRKRVF